MRDDDRLRRLGDLDVGDPPPMADLVDRSRRRATRRHLGEAVVLAAVLLLIVGATAVWRTGDGHVQVDPAGPPAVPGTTGAGTTSSVVASGPPTVVSRVPIGRYPYDATVGGGSVWILQQDGTVARVDPDDGRVIATIPLPAPSYAATRLTVTDDAVWVTKPSGADHERGELVRIDLETGRITTIATTVRPLAVAVAADGRHLWIAGPRPGQLGALQRVDPTTGRLDAPIDLPAGTPMDVVVDDEGVWVLGQQHQPGSWIERFDPATGERTGHLDLADFAVRLVDAGDRLVIGLDTSGGGGRTGRVVLVDPRTLEVVASAELSARPEAIVVTDRTIVTSGPRALDRRTLAPVPLELSLEPLGFTLALAGGSLWASRAVDQTGAAELVRIDLGTLA